MSQIFAIASRWRAGNRWFWRDTAFLAVFLAWQTANAQGTNAIAVPAPNAPGAPAANVTMAPATNAAPPVATNTLALASNNSATLPPVDNSSFQLNDTNISALLQSPAADPLAPFKARLEDARHLRLIRQTAVAEPILIALLGPGIPDSIQRDALLELAATVQDENDLVRAEQIYEQFVNRWSTDRRIPEVYLHQGQLYRQMGLNTLALAKFYGVMTTALSLKSDQLDYYQKLVLQAQMEIAETHYQAGQYADAADFFSRLLKQQNPSLNRPEIQFRLIRSLQATSNFTDTAAQASDFLSRYPDSPNQPEVRFCYAEALKALGRNNESLQQVLLLLKHEQGKAKTHPGEWAYWQQRTGNEIGNQLYREGDYPKALDIYLTLQGLDRSCAWQFPVTYQVGMTYERLMQPQLAMQSYSNIVSRAPELGTNASPGLKAIVDMAQWRINFLKWQDHADNVNRSMEADPSETSAAKTPEPSLTAMP